MGDRRTSPLTSEERIFTMPATAKTSRDAWVQSGLDVLAEGGVDAITVEAIASRLGVTKGGFYGMFGGRRDFLTVLLEEWERRASEEVLARVEVGGGIRGCRRAWALRDADVAARLPRVDNVRIGFLRERFGLLFDDPGEVEARSTAAFAIAIGEPLMATDHLGRSREDAIRLTIDRVILRFLTRRA